MFFLVTTLESVSIVIYQQVGSRFGLRIEERKRAVNSVSYVWRLAKFPVYAKLPCVSVLVKFFFLISTVLSCYSVVSHCFLFFRRFWLLTLHHAAHCQVKNCIPLISNAHGRKKKESRKNRLGVGGGVQ